MASLEKVWKREAKTIRKSMSSLSKAVSKNRNMIAAFEALAVAGEVTRDKIEAASGDEATKKRYLEVLAKVINAGESGAAGARRLEEGLILTEAAIEGLKEIALVIEGAAR